MAELQRLMEGELRDPKAGVPQITKRLNIRMPLLYFFDAYDVSFQIKFWDSFQMRLPPFCWGSWVDESDQT